MGTGHECSHFFMPHLNKFNAFAHTSQGFHDAVDSIARIAKYSFHIPADQSLNKVFTYSHAERTVEAAIFTIPMYSIISICFLSPTAFVYSHRIAVTINK